MSNPIAPSPAPVARLDNLPLGVEFRLELRRAVGAARLADAQLLWDPPLSESGHIWLRQAHPRKGRTGVVHIAVSAGCSRTVLTQFLDEFFHEGALTMELALPGARGATLAGRYRWPADVPVSVVAEHGR